MLLHRFLLTYSIPDCQQIVDSCIEPRYLAILKHPVATSRLIERYLKDEEARQPVYIYIYAAGSRGLSSHP